MPQTGVLKTGDFEPGEVQVRTSKYELLIKNVHPSL